VAITLITTSRSAVDDRGLDAEIGEARTILERQLPFVQVEQILLLRLVRESMNEECRGHARSSLSGRTDRAVPAPLIGAVRLHEEVADTMVVDINRDMHLGRALLVTAGLLRFAFYAKGRVTSREDRGEAGSAPPVAYSPYHPR
jgi:hypothetical protein